MNSTSKIIALDLQNATLENLGNWFCTNDFITAETTKEFIRFRVKDEENQFQRIFVINDTLGKIILPNKPPSSLNLKSTKNLTSSINSTQNHSKTQ